MGYVQGLSTWNKILDLTNFSWFYHVVSAVTNNYYKVLNKVKDIDIIFFDNISEILIYVKFVSIRLYLIGESSVHQKNFHAYEIYTGKSTIA